MNPFESKLITRLRADQRLTDPRWIAYILATTKHETNSTFQPVEEAYWLSDAWRHANLRYAPWWGRGFVQITWKANYEKLSHRLSIPELATNPDAALDWDIAYEILVVGMLEGLFTGRDLDDYINEDYCDYLRARRIVNGMDKASLIAGYARDYESAIKAKPAEPSTAFPYPAQHCHLLTFSRDNPTKHQCVELLQRALNKWGEAKDRTLSPIYDDGVFGPNTMSRVILFQHQENLLPDGIVGSKTWAALTPHI
jgi:hypothetical protein